MLLQMFADAALKGHKGGGRGFLHGIAGLGLWERLISPPLRAVPAGDIPGDAALHTPPRIERKNPPEPDPNQTKLTGVTLQRHLGLRRTSAACAQVFPHPKRF